MGYFPATASPPGLSACLTLPGDSAGGNLDIVVKKTRVAHGTGAWEARGRVAYLLAADIVSRLPSCRLSDDHQPVIMTRNRFSTSRSSLFPSLYAHPSRSIPRSSPGILF